MKDTRLFGFFPHPSRWKAEHVLLWLAISVGFAPLGVVVLILSYRLDKEDRGRSEC